MKALLVLKHTIWPALKVCETSMLSTEPSSCLLPSAELSRDRRRATYTLVPALQALEERVIISTS
jgi:hypothetical protein